MILMGSITIILSILVVINIFKTKQKTSLITSEVMWICVPWLLCLLLYFFSGIKYTYNLDFISYLYIIICIGLFVTGTYFSKKIKIKNIKIKKKDSNNKLLNIMFYISVISVIIYSYYLLYINKIEWGITREISRNYLTTILLIFSSSSLIIWLYGLSKSLVYNNKLKIKTILSAVIYNIPGILISGRDALMIFIISTLIVFFASGFQYKRKNNSYSNLFIKICKTFLILLLPITIYLVFLSKNRYGTNIVSMFENSAYCKIPTYLVSFSNLGIGKLFLNIVFYYSSQFSKLAFVIQNYRGPYLFGFYQLHYISRMLPSSWNLSYDMVSNTLNTIFNEKNAISLKGFWETGIGYSIYDFGLIGTLIVSFIGGTIVKKILDICSNLKYEYSIICKSITCTGLFLTVEMSPLFDYFYIFPLFWMFIFVIFNHKWSIKKHKNNEI